MNVAIDISGQLKKMTGIQHYVDSLLGGLRDLQTPHEIVPFLPAYDRQIKVEEFATDGLFCWRDMFSVRSPGRELVCGEQPFVHAHEGLQRSANVIDKWIVRRYNNHARQGRLNRLTLSFDLMHIPEAGDLDFLRYKCRRSIATIFDLTTVVMASRHDPGNVTHWGIYNRYVAENCARVITISEHSKRDIMEHLGVPEDRIDVTPLAPRASASLVKDREELTAVREKFGLQDRPFVLYAGTLEPRKNLMRLVEGFAEAVKSARMPEHRLVLAGGNWGRHDLELRLRAYEVGIGPQVITTGYVSNAEMNALMSSCEAFAYVSEYEGFGLPPLEAMVCGAPVVVSGTTSLPEVVGEAGLQVEPSDAGAIAGALHVLLTDVGENARQRALSLARAQAFSWERTARLTLKAYEAAVA